MKKKLEAEYHPKFNGMANTKEIYLKKKKKKRNESTRRIFKYQ